MSDNRCRQILAAVDNDITKAAYQIFCECQANENIKAKDWEALVSGLSEEDKKKLEGVVGNLTHAWMPSAPCANLVALVRWRSDTRGLVRQTWREGNRLGDDGAR